MCDNSRECQAAKANGFARFPQHRPIDDEPAAQPVGPAPASVRPGWNAGRRLVAVPWEAGEGLSAERSAHFGRAAGFALVTLEGDSAAFVKLAPNGPHGDGGGHGFAARMLVAEGVTDVVTAGIGPGMYERLATGGVRVWRDEDSATVGDAVRALASGVLQPVDVA